MNSSPMKKRHYELVHVANWLIEMKKIVIIFVKYDYVYSETF